MDSPVEDELDVALSLVLLVLLSLVLLDEPSPLDASLDPPSALGALAVLDDEPSL